MKNHNMTRMQYITDNNIRVLRYKTGSFPHWLIRRICIVNNVSYESVLQFRINDSADHWAMIVRNDKPVKPFTDEALLGF